MMPIAWLRHRLLEALNTEHDEEAWQAAKAGWIPTFRLFFQRMWK